MTLNKKTQTKHKDIKEAFIAPRKKHREIKEDSVTKTSPYYYLPDMISKRYPQTPTEIQRYQRDIYQGT